MHIVSYYHTLRLYHRNADYLQIPTVFVSNTSLQFKMFT